MSCQPKISEQLHLMDREQFLDRLQFGNNFILDQEVEDVTTVKMDFLVANWNRDLAPEFQACL